MLNEHTKLWRISVVDQASGILINGIVKRIKCKQSNPKAYASQNPRESNHELFGFESPCPPAIILFTATYH